MVSLEGAVEAVEEQMEKAGYFGQQYEDRISRFLYWLHPPLKKERDLLLDKLQDYRQRLTEAEELATRFALEDQKHRIEAEALKRPETPRVLRPGTSAEVRRMMELGSWPAYEEEKEN